MNKVDLALASSIKKRTSLGSDMQKLFGKIDPQMLWNRKVDKGWSTIPRTIPLIMEIMDKLSDGNPPSKTYLALWSRAEDNNQNKEDAMVIKISGILDQLAIESGFLSSRKISTLESRIKILENLGFIQTKTTNQKLFGKYEYILIIHPEVAIKSIFKNLPKTKNEADLIALYKIFIDRSKRVGAIKKVQPKKAVTAPPSTEEKQTA